MEFTVTFLTLLVVTTTWASQAANEKREAPVSYSPGHQTHGYQAPALGQDDGNAISISAGYSVGGAKPSYSFESQPSGPSLQISQEALQSGGHAYQMAPITLQPGQDINQLMSQLTQSLNSGALSLQQEGNGLYASQGQEAPSYQIQYVPQTQQLGPQEQAQGLPSPPSYAAGTKGLGSYGSVGPALFNPAPGPSYPSQFSGHSIGDSLSGLSLGSSQGLSFAGHNFGGQLKGSLSNYPSFGKSSFKPSAYVGSAESGHGLSGLHAGPGSFAGPSYASSSQHFLSGNRGHPAHPLSSSSHGSGYSGSISSLGGPSHKYVASTNFSPNKYESFGASLNSLSSLSPKGHFSSPPGTTYGIPSGAYSVASNSAHSASSQSPQYYAMSVKSPFPGKFSGGSSSFRASLPSPSYLSSHPSGQQYSFSSQSGGSRFGPPKDIQGDYSETNYNTIKYSEELRPRV